MKREIIDKILEYHLHWLKEDCDGWEQMRADFTGKHLGGTDLHCLDEYDMMLYIADRYNIAYKETITYERI